MQFIMSDIEAQIITQPIIEAENIAPEENKCYRFLYLLFIIYSFFIIIILFILSILFLTCSSIALSSASNKATVSLFLLR